MQGLFPAPTLTLGRTALTSRMCSSTARRGSMSLGSSEKWQLGPEVTKCFPWVFTNTVFIFQVSQSEQKTKPLCWNSWTRSWARAGWGRVLGWRLWASPKSVTWPDWSASNLGSISRMSVQSCSAGQPGFRGRSEKLSCQLFWGYFSFLCKNNFELENNTRLVAVQFGTISFKFVYSYGTWLSLFDCK